MPAGLSDYDPIRLGAEALNAEFGDANDDSEGAIKPYEYAAELVLRAALPTADEVIDFLDEWIDDLAPLNREAFRPAAEALLERLGGQR